MNERRGYGNSARPEGGLSAQRTGCAGAKPTTTRSVRRGAVVLIRHGDPEISEGIAEGIMRAREQGNDGDLIRQPCALPPSPTGEGSGETDEPKALPHEQVEVVEAEIDRQKIQRSLLRVAVGNTKTNDDYDAMITKARGDYGERRWGGALRRIGTALLVVYAMAVYALAMAYRAQDIVLGRR